MEDEKPREGHYIAQHKLDECWLVLFNNLFEIKDTSSVGHPDRAWFENFSAFELQDLKCPYERVLFNLEHPSIWYSLYDKKIFKIRSNRIQRWPTIVLKESAVLATEATVYEIDLSNSIKRDFFS